MTRLRNLATRLALHVAATWDRIDTRHADACNEKEEA